MSRLIASLGSLAATAAVAFAAPAAFAGIDIDRAASAARDRVEAYAKALKGSGERGEWIVRNCHSVDDVEVACTYHVRLRRHGRSVFHRDGTVSVVERGGRYVARLR